MCTGGGFTEVILSPTAPGDALCSPQLLQDPTCRTSSSSVPACPHRSLDSHHPTEPAESSQVLLWEIWWARECSSLLSLYFRGSILLPPYCKSSKPSWCFSWAAPQSSLSPHSSQLTPIPPHQATSLFYSTLLLSGYSCALLKSGLLLILNNYPSCNSLGQDYFLYYLYFLIFYPLTPPHPGTPHLCLRDSRTFSSQTLPSVGSKFCPVQHTFRHSCPWTVWVLHRQSAVPIIN